jgi:hypothetical protein
MLVIQAMQGALVLVVQGGREAELTITLTAPAIEDMLKIRLQVVLGAVVIPVLAVLVLRVIRAVRVTPVLRLLA